MSSSQFISSNGYFASADHLSSLANGINGSANSSQQAQADQYSGFAPSATLNAAASAFLNSPYGSFKSSYYPYTADASAQSIYSAQYAAAASSGYGGGARDSLPAQRDRLYQESLSGGPSAATPAAAVSLLSNQMSAVGLANVSTPSAALLGSGANSQSVAGGCGAANGRGSGAGANSGTTATAAGEELCNPYAVAQQYHQHYHTLNGYSPQVQPAAAFGMFPGFAAAGISAGMAPYQYHSWMNMRAGVQFGPNGDRKRGRQTYTRHQTLQLEGEFHTNRYLTRRKRIDLAHGLGLSERQIKIWFQNRRMKAKKELKAKEEESHNGSATGKTSSVVSAAADSHHHSHRRQPPQQHANSFHVEQQDVKPPHLKHPFAVNR